MKLFLYDEKHEAVHGELDLGKLNSDQIVFLQKIVKFLDEQGVTSRYRQLKIADNYTVEGDYEERIVVFHASLE